MDVRATKLPGVLLLRPAWHGDARGFFSEVYNAATLAAHGIDIPFVQDNQSVSEKAGTLRGLHWQAPPYAQAKLVRCGRGALWDVAVDLRVGSPTYGQWTGVELSAGNGCQLLIPAGFAHGFVTRMDDTEVLYKCSASYAPGAEGVLAWDDPDVAIDWGVDAPVLLDRDASAPRLADITSPFMWDAP